MLKPAYRQFIASSASESSQGIFSGSEAIIEKLTEYNKVEGSLGVLCFIPKSQAKQE